VREELVVIGAGGHAKVVIATALAAGWTVGGVVDDDPQVWGRTILGYEITGPVSRASDLGRAGIIAVGNNHTRRVLAERGTLGWATVVHPDAVIHPSVCLGEGTVVFAGTVIQPDTVVGVHSIVNTGASVDHDCLLGDFVHIAPGVRLAGGVRLGEGVLMGIGSCALPMVNLGSWSIIGGGAVVVGNLPANVTVVGVPARVVTLENCRE